MYQCMRTRGDLDPPTDRRYGDGREDQNIPDSPMTYRAPAEARPLSGEHRKESRWSRAEYVEPAKYRRQGGEFRGNPN